MAAARSARHVLSSMNRTSTGAAKVGAIVTAICVMIVVAKEPNSQTMSGCQGGTVHGLLDQTAHADKTTQTGPANGEKAKASNMPHNDYKAAAEGQVPKAGERGEMLMLSEPQPMGSMRQLEPHAATQGWLGTASAQVTGAAGSAPTEPGSTATRKGCCLGDRFNFSSLSVGQAMPHTATGTQPHGNAAGTRRSQGAPQARTQYVLPRRLAPAAHGTWSEDEQPPHTILIYLQNQHKPPSPTPKSAHTTQHPTAHT